MANVVPAIIEVEWIDSIAINHGEWTDVEELDEVASREALRHRSAGYLVCDGKDAVVIASSINDQKDQEPEDLRVAGAVAIPKKAILSRTTLKEASDAT